MWNKKLLDLLEEFIEGSRETKKISRRRWFRNMLTPMIAGTATAAYCSGAAGKGEDLACGAQATHICNSNNTCITTTNVCGYNYCNAGNSCDIVGNACEIENECWGGNSSKCLASTNVCKTSDKCDEGENTCAGFDICAGDDKCNGKENKCTGAHTCNTNNICTQDDGCWGINECFEVDEDCSWCDISCTFLTYASSKRR